MISNLSYTNTHNIQPSVDKEGKLWYPNDMKDFIEHQPDKNYQKFIWYLINGK